MRGIYVNIHSKCGHGSTKSTGSDTTLVNLLKKDYLHHGINVVVDEGKIDIDFHVIVSYGVSISAVSENLMETVRYKVKEFTETKLVFYMGEEKIALQGKLLSSFLH